MKIGENITSLRKEKNITQKGLAEHLNVSVRTILKWEHGYAMPSFAIIPEIAAFLGVPVEKIFDFEKFEDTEPEAISEEAGKYSYDDPEKAEGILREGLERFPEDEIILINLLYILTMQQNWGDETLKLCKKVLKFKGLSSNRKYDLYRILANCYAANDQDDKIGSALEKIPYLESTRLELEALLLNGEDSYAAANKEKYLSAHRLVDMLMILGYHWENQGDKNKALSQFKLAKNVIQALKNDYFDPEYADKTVYDQLQEWREEIDDILCEYN